MWNDVFCCMCSLAGRIGASPDKEVELCEKETGLRGAAVPDHINKLCDHKDFLFGQV